MRVLHSIVISAAIMQKWFGKSAYFQDTGKAWFPCFS